MQNNVLLGAAVVFLASAAIAEDDLKHAVRCSEIGFSLSVERRDLDAFAEYVASDARFVAAGVLRGRDEVVAGWQPMFAEDGPRLSWRPAIIEVVQEAGLALSRGPYKVEAQTESGETSVVWGTFNSVWRRQPDGSWQVMFDAGGDHGKTPTAEEVALFEQDDNCQSLD